MFMIVVQGISQIGPHLVRVYEGFLPILEPCSSGGILTYWVDEDFNIFENDDPLNPTGVAKNAAPLDISEKGKRHAPKPTEVAKSIAPLNECENGKQRIKNPALGAKRFFEAHCLIKMSSRSSFFQCSCSCPWCFC